MLKKFFKSKRNILGLQVADWLILLLGLAVFTAIALFNITKSSIWFDEAFSAYLIRFDIVNVARYTANDIHPPLYYWLLKSWGFIFGHSEFALRSMSVFFGGISIAIGYVLASKLFNKNVARFSLLFMAISPMFIRYSQEMRMYTLAAAISVAATYMLVVALESKKKLPWIVYGMLVSLGMWTHYFTAVVWIAHWIWRADEVRRQSGKGKFLKTFFSKQWVMAYAIAIGFFIPWMKYFILQTSVVQAFGFWIPAVTPDTLPNFITNIFFYLEVGTVNGWFALGIILAVVFLAILAAKVYKAQNKEQRQSYRLIMAVAFVPALLLIVLSMPPLRSAFVDRYLVPSVLFVSIFIGVTLGQGLRFIKLKWRLLLVALLVGFMAYGVTNVWYFGNYSKTSNASNNTRQIIESVVEKAQPGQPIIASSPWLFYEAIPYAQADNPMYFINAKTEYKSGALDMLKYNDYHKIKDIDKFVAENPIVWYVGLPRGEAFDPPYSNWRALQKLSVADSINGKPAYEAIQYIIE
ncbi:MAG: glycosyltransferase family 39 protein [Candidatus Saccharibacteria bacterium]